MYQLIHVVPCTHSYIYLLILHFEEAIVPGLLAHLVWLFSFSYSRINYMLFVCTQSWIQGWSNDCFHVSTHYLFSVYPCRKWVTWANITKIFLLKPGHPYSQKHLLHIWMSDDYLQHGKEGCLIESIFRFITEFPTEDWNSRYTSLHAHAHMESHLPTPMINCLNIVVSRRVPS